MWRCRSAVQLRSGDVAAQRAPYALTSRCSCHECAIGLHDILISILAGENLNLQHAPV